MTRPALVFGPSPSAKKHLPYGGEGWYAAPLTDDQATTLQARGAAVLWLEDSLLETPSGPQQWNAKAEGDSDAWLVRHEGWLGPKLPAEAIVVDHPATGVALVAAPTADRSAATRDALVRAFGAENVAPWPVAWRLSPAVSAGAPFVAFKVDPSTGGTLKVDSTAAALAATVVNVHQLSSMPAEPETPSWKLSLPAPEAPGARVAIVDAGGPNPTLLPTSRTHQATTASRDDAGHGATMAALVQAFAPGTQVQTLAVGYSSAYDAAVATFDDVLAGGDAQPRLVVEEVGLDMLCKAAEGAILLLPFERQNARTDPPYGALCNDIDRITSAQPDVVVVCAAGNALTEANPIGAPGAAKNAITFGMLVDAAGGNIPPDGERGAVSRHSRQGSRHRAHFGTKPDLYAPGAGVLGPRPPAMVMWDGSATSAWHRGSSVSAAIGAAAVASLRAAYPTLSAAAIKAVLLGRSEAAGNDRETGPAAVRALPERPMPLWVWDADAKGGLAQGETRSWACAGNIRATLVWTDPPSDALCGGWMRRLVLHVSGQGQRVLCQEAGAQSVELQGAETLQVTRIPLDPASSAAAAPCAFALVLSGEAAFDTEGWLQVL